MASVCRTVETARSLGKLEQRGLLQRAGRGVAGRGRPWPQSALCRAAAESRGQAGLPRGTWSFLRDVAWAGGRSDVPKLVNTLLGVGKVAVGRPGP